MEASATTEWKASLLVNQGLFDWASSWLNQRGHRDRLDDITLTESKALWQGFIIAELKILLLGLIMAVLDKSSPPNRRHCRG